MEEAPEEEVDAEEAYVAPTDEELPGEAYFAPTEEQLPGRQRVTRRSRSALRQHCRVSNGGSQKSSSLSARQAAQISAEAR